LPSEEEIDADPSKADFIMVDENPVIVIKYYAGTEYSYTVEIKSRFTSTYADFC
jgi:hypothetical protein